MSKVLVTGGAGFIGSHLVKKLLDEKNEVLVFDDLSNSEKKNIDKRAKFLQGDCRDLKDVQKLFKEFHPDIVFHLAADAAEGKSQFSPIDITSRNYDAFIKILTYSIKNKVKRFVFTSSIAVYGALQTPFKETDKPEPEDLYGVSKLAAEQSLKIMSKVHDFEYVIVRPHNVYGPGQNMHDPYRNVVTLWMNSILRNEPYYIYGKGEQRRCFSYIDDVIEAIYKCGFEKVAGMTFNIGADRDYSLNELSDAILRISNSKIKPIYIKDRPQEVQLAISDHTQSKKYLGYKDKTTLEEGLAKTWAWVKKQGPQETNLKPLEIDSEKAPGNWRVSNKYSK